jgi:hypothetical protein
MPIKQNEYLMREGTGPINFIKINQYGYKVHKEAYKIGINIRDIKYYKKNKLICV